MTRFALLFLCLIPFVSNSQDMSLYQKKEFQYETHSLPYRILYPENYDAGKKYPLVLVLHGAGERGTDNELQLTHGAKLFLKEENRKNFPAIVIFPQCPKESFWPTAKVDTSGGKSELGFDYSMQPGWPLMAANELVKQMIKENRADQKRIYITGLSMGGMGTFESVFRFPELYAAALPICGGGDVATYDQRVKPTRFWVFHGDADVVVPVKLSRNMVAQLKKLKVKVIYTEYPGVNHNSWDNAFAEPDYLKWMFQQKRKK